MRYVITTLMLLLLLLASPGWAAKKITELPDAASVDADDEFECSDSTGPTSEKCDGAAIQTFVLGPGVTFSAAAPANSLAVEATTGDVDIGSQLTLDPGGTFGATTGACWGDGDTCIFETADDTWSFETAGFLAFSVDADQDVLISDRLVGATFSIRAATTSSTTNAIFAPFGNGGSSDGLGGAINAPALIVSGVSELTATAGLVTVPSNLAVGGTVLGDVLVEANTAGSGAPNVLVGSESGSLLTNEGSTAENHHDLPTAIAGLQFQFVVQDVDGIQVNAATGDTIRIGATASASAGFVSSIAIGDVLHLIAINATEWVSTGPAGGWTFDT